MPYTVTLYVAAPGTPIKNEPNVETSMPGHMYYSIDNDLWRESYGFAPAVNGQMDGPGKPWDSDEANYQNPRYVRTMEITPDQYTQLQNFGKDPEKFGFSMEYKDARHNCIDFTWSALEHAGIKSHTKVLGITLWDNEHHGLRPVDNIDYLKTIDNPIPHSEYNHERWHPMPTKNWLHHPVDSVLQKFLLSETEQQKQVNPQSTSISKNSSTDDLFNSIMSAHLSGDDKALKQAQVTAFNSDLAQNSFNEVRQQNITAEKQLAEQQRQAELEHQQTVAMPTPVRTMRM